MKITINLPMQLFHDNVEAYKEVQRLMRLKQDLELRFKTINRQNVVSVEAKGVAPFPYFVKDEAFQGILHYLNTGEATDFDFDPNAVELKPLDYNYQNKMALWFHEHGYSLQFPPLYREYQWEQRAFIPFLYGRIFFLWHRGDLDWLRENELISY